MVRKRRAIPGNREAWSGVANDKMVTRCLATDRASAKAAAHPDSSPSTTGET
jgi:hypothetical protein